MKSRLTYRFFKRFFDIFSSSIAIILLSPVFLILGIIVKCTSKGPVFYSHKRVGKNGKEIGVLKFRSMIKNADKKYICPVCRSKKKGGENNDGIRLGYHHGGDLRGS